jgi:molybdate transport system regulatory protein
MVKNIPDKSTKLIKPRRYSRHPRTGNTGYIIKGRVWVEKNGELYLGWGHIQLLENIEKLGSIASAARAMNLGYRNAWLWVDAMNRLAPSPLVEKCTGGAKGGYAKLTEEAHKAIKYYKNLHNKLQEFVNKFNEET